MKKTVPLKRGQLCLPLFKFLVVMKLAIVLILVSAVQLYAGVYGQKITVQAQQTEIKKILTKIEKTTDVRFLYNYDLAPLNKKIDFTVNNIDLPAALNQLFASTSLQYRILNDNLVVVMAGDNAAAYQPAEIQERKDKLYNQQPLLKINRLSTWFPVNSGFFSRSKVFVKAVNEVSFDVYPGETLGLAGESGCGKTTLGRSILRLIEPTSGSIEFGGTNLRGLGKKDLRDIRKDIQIIFQDPYSSLNPRLTVGDSLMEPLQVHQFYANHTRRKKKVLELLERVNLLPEHFNRYPHEFSGGQRQRIVIARALALQPKFIICDESVSALDVSVQAQVLNLIRELQQELNLTYIFISHDLAVIKHISDRMMIMNKGEIVEMGDPDEIYYHPKEEYTKKLIASIPGN